MQGSMACQNRKLMPLSADNRVRLLAELQGSPHFEKSLTTATASGGKAALTMPSWFVREHGEKFRKSVLLRTQLSAKSIWSAWSVTLSVRLFTPTKPQVTFSGGWKRFATSNGLSEGDWLIFALTAMSEFKVYVFRNMEGPSKSPSPAQRKWPYDSDCSRKRAKRPEEELSSDLEGSDKCSNDSVIANRMRPAILHDAVGDSAIAPGPPSRREHSLHLLPSFWKTLTVSNVSRARGYLEIPRDFWTKYGSRIHSVVKLQGIHERSPERTMACTISYGKDIRYYLRAEWRAFVIENHLHVGQQLLFTLSANSFFVVREESARRCEADRLHLRV